jgi:Carboxypeptidase regulatory-like domain
MSPTQRFRSALAIASFFVTAAALGGTVTGTIRAASSQEPLAGKIVAAYDTAGTLRGSATSDATGLYLLSLPAGSYRVLAYDNDGVYATSFDGNAESFETSPLTAVGATNSVTRNFALVVGGSATGLVTSMSGAPRINAVVEAYNLSGTRRGFTTTDASGVYSLVLPPGQYKFVAYDANPDFAFSFHRDVRTFAEAVPVGVVATQVTSGISFRIEVAARVTGTVVEGATNLPLAGITVYAYTPGGALVEETVTDNAGVFRFALPPGDYRFVAADPARTFAPGFFGSVLSFETASVVALTAGSQQSNVQLALTRGATIAGVVRDANGAAVPNVTVGAYNADGTLHTTAITNANGAYQLLVAPGTYNLAAFDLQLTYAPRVFGGSLGVATGQALNGMNFSLLRGGRVTGTVREGSSPRAGITVAAYDAAGILAASAITDANGVYALVVAPGDYRLVAFDTANRYAASYDRGALSFDETVPRSIAANATVTADIALRRGVSVSGEVVDAAGKAISGVNVFALDPAGNRVAGATSSAGAFTLIVPAGSYRYMAVDPAGRYAMAILPGALPLRFVLAPAPLKRRVIRH